MEEFEEHFDKGVTDIVSAALKKARTASHENMDMPYRKDIKLERTMITYALDSFQSPLKDGAWLTVFTESLQPDRGFYDTYIECCKRNKKRPNEAHFVKTFLVIQFFTSIQRQGLTDVGFQVHVSGVHVESKRTFSTNRLIGRYVSKPAAGNYGFLRTPLRYPDLSEPMRQVMDEHGAALSVMQAGDKANLVFPYPAILDYLVNYM